MRGSAGEKFVVVALVAEGAMYLLTMMETSCGHWAKSRRAKATYRYLYTYVHISMIILGARPKSSGFEEIDEKNQGPQ